MYSTAQIRSVRAADAICLDHHADGTAAIRAITRQTGTTSEVTVTLPVEVSRVDNYGTGDGPWTAFAYFGASCFDHRWQTIARLIRRDSRLGFVWIRDNASPITRDAGVVIDMLDIQVQNGSTSHTIRVETRVSLDNTARMIRPA